MEELIKQMNLATFKNNKVAWERLKSKFQEFVAAKHPTTDVVDLTLIATV